MRLQGTKKVHYDSGPNMTPLVDVVMVILIFLMLAGSFAGAEQYLTSNMPMKANGPSKTPLPPGFIPDQQLEIRVDAQNVTGDAANDSFVARAGQITTGDIETLKTGLVGMRQKLNANGTTDEHIQVVINPGRFVRYQTLIRIYTAALDASFTKVAFSTPH